MRIQRKVAAVGCVNMAIGGDWRRDDPGAKGESSWSGRENQSWRNKNARRSQAATFTSRRRGSRRREERTGVWRIEDVMLFQPAREKRSLGLINYAAKTGGSKRLRGASPLRALVPPDVHKWPKEGCAWCRFRALFCRETGRKGRGVVTPLLTPSLHPSSRPPLGFIFSCSCSFFSPFFACLR